MAKQLSIGNVVVFDKGLKHQHCSSINPKTRYSFSVGLDRGQETAKKNIITKKEIAQLISWKQKVAAEHKQAQDSCLMRTKNPPGSSKDPADVFLESYPFVEEPVRFYFGDDYGSKQLFCGLHREIIYGNLSTAASSDRGAMKYFVSSDDDDVNSLATETEMMNSFLKDNLILS